MRSLCEFVSECYSDLVRTRGESKFGCEARAGRASGFGSSEQQQLDSPSAKLTTNHLNHSARQALGAADDSRLRSACALLSRFDRSLSARSLAPAVVPPSWQP